MTGRSGRAIAMGPAATFLLPLFFSIYFKVSSELENEIKFPFDAGRRLIVILFLFIFFFSFLFYNIYVFVNE